jgi:flagellar biogenesis protein FliO
LKTFKQSLLFVSTLVTVNAFASDVTVKGLEIHSSATKGIGQLSVKIAGQLNENPELNVVGKNIELKIPSAHVNSKITKKVGDISLGASQFDRSTVKIVATLPNSLAGKEGLVTVTLKDGSVDLNFPSNISTNETKVSRSPSIKEAAPIIANKEAEKLDESYLQKLETEHENENAKKVVETTKETKVTDQDRVKLSQSSVLKSNNTGATSSTNEPKPAFSVAGYIGKFVAFLSLMLLGFYGVLTLFKKGVIKKGRLGFLNSTKLVEVLSTTHIAPKRNLMMVKAHKQVFLIATSETGIQLISEIQDVAGLIKTGEAEIAGNNFDTNLYQATKVEKEFKIKEVNNDYADYDSLDDMLNDSSTIIPEKSTNAAKAIEKRPVKDQVKLSEQIKSKIKNLKQLQ